MIQRICIYAFLILLSYTTAWSQASATAAGISAKGLERYEAYLQRQVDAGAIPGAVSLVYRQGNIAHSKAIGYNNMVEKDPMTTDKIFFIQSMTKPVVSIAFMTLFEEGYFQLDDPVSKYRPEFADLKVIQVDRDEDGNPTGTSLVPLKTPITIKHLLTHTAGFTHGLGQSDYDKKLFSLLYEQPYESIQDRVAALVSYPMAGQPGEQWYYSAAPDILSVLIEHFTGKTTAQILQERIFDPLEMDDTGYNVSDANLDRVVQLHQQQPDGRLAPVDQWNPLQGNTVYGGTHGLYSTASDYLKFAKMLLNGGASNGHRIVSRKTLELMADDHTKGLYKDRPGTEFGLGFGVITDVPASGLSGSEGSFFWSGAFNTYFMVDPQEELIMILMTQSWPYRSRPGKMMSQLIYSSIDD